MRSLSFGLTWVVLLALPLSALGDVWPYSELLKSKSVQINGLEFAAVTQARWIMLDSSSPADPLPEPIIAQLWITNRTRKDVLFGLFDTFGISIENSSGQELLTGGRDHSLVSKPVLLHPGDIYCLSHDAGLGWSQGGRESPGSKTQIFQYEDGTGAWFVSTPLIAGKYAFSFWVNSNGLDMPLAFRGRIILRFGREKGRLQMFSLKLSIHSNEVCG